MNIIQQLVKPIWNLFPDTEMRLEHLKSKDKWTIIFYRDKCLLLFKNKVDELLWASFSTYKF